MLPSFSHLILKGGGATRESEAKTRFQIKIYLFLSIFFATFFSKLSLSRKNGKRRFVPKCRHLWSHSKNTLHFLALPYELIRKCLLKPCYLKLFFLLPKALKSELKSEKVSVTL